MLVYFRSLPDRTKISMGLLDDDPKPLYTPPKSKRFVKQTALSQEERDTELNNFDREYEQGNTSSRRDRAEDSEGV